MRMDKTRKIADLQAPNLRGWRTARRPLIRYVAQITGDLPVTQDRSTEDVAKLAQDIILNWIYGKARDVIPGRDAGNPIDGETFSLDSIPGHKFEAVRIDNPTVWASKIEHPDEFGRTWTVEAEIACIEKRALFGVRSYVTTVGEFDAPLTPSIPRFTRDIINRIGLLDADQPLRDTPWHLENSEDIELLYRLLQNPRRSLPVVLVTETHRTERNSQNTTTLIDARRLARMATGLAHIVSLPYDLGYEWTERVGKEWSAFLGAVRTYRPNLTWSYDELHQHPRATQDRIISWRSEPTESIKAFTRFLVNQLYYDSVNAPGWRDRFAPFNEVKLKSLELNKQDTAELQQLREEYQNQVESALSEAITEEQRRREAEEELNRIKAENYNLQWQNDQLRAQIESSTGYSSDENIELPECLDDLDSWSEKYLSGRLFLHPRALRAAKKSFYENTPLIFKSLLLLANEYRNMRLSNSDKHMKEKFDGKLKQLELELQPSISGQRAGEEGDTYFVHFPPNQQQKRLLDLHLKKGASKDQRYCLRIYFFWDDETRQVVVGSLPGHLDTRQT